MPLTDSRATRSKSLASAKTKFGDLPPHSNDTDFILDCPEYCRNNFPTSVEPVNATLSTPGCKPRALPVTSPSPGNTLNTPSGISAMAANSATRIALNGACSAGFNITLFPAASAGANFQAAINNGKFQGTTIATTPTGSRVIMAKALSFLGAISSYTLSMASAYQRRVSTTPGMSAS